MDEIVIDLEEGTIFVKTADGDVAVFDNVMEEDNEEENPH